MKKQYYAYVAKDMIGCFLKKLLERGNEIKVIKVDGAFSEKGEQVMYMVLEAEEGIIDSKWELKETEEDLV